MIGCAAVKTSPIFSKTYDLLLWLVPRTLAFPKSHRGVLARRVQERAFDLMEALQASALGPDAERRLLEADYQLAALRTYLRLSRELRLITPEQFEHAARLIVEIGRLLGAWRKKVEGRDRPSQDGIS